MSSSVRAPPTSPKSGDPEPGEIWERVRKGDRRALGRLISDVEAGTPGSRELLRWIYGRTGRATVVGLSGPLGVGKSSLLNLLIRHLRKHGRTVGVIAVDPSSPFTGGAVLGDRIRINRPAGDQGVFIRSMASRGHAGGVSQSTREVIRLLDAAGMDVILVETVGSGQSDVEIHELATTRVVILVPHLGDEVQSLKAGLYEIADVFVVNKADLPGADQATRYLVELSAMVPAGPDGWRPRVVQTSALQERGIADLWTAIEAHEEHLAQGPQGRDLRRHRLEREIQDLVRDRLTRDLREKLRPGRELSRLVDEVVERRLDPYTAADRAYAEIKHRRGD
jgi:LAO/AO transport system kinase